jgi:hypothetical protein
MRLMGAIGSFAASMIGGLGIVQQRLQLVGGTNLIHFDFVPTLDGGCVTATDSFVAESEVAPVDALSACGCGVQKDGVIWVLRDQLDVLRGYARGSFRGIWDIGGVDHTQG